MMCGTGLVFHKNGWENACLFDGFLCNFYS